MCNLQHYHQLRGDPRALPRDEPLRRQPATDARAIPDYPAPAVRNVGADRELTTMRWGMPPPRACGFPVTDIRNTSSLRWRMWLKPETAWSQPTASLNMRRSQS
jgi:putative SOS response-associated peptidase YedK